MTRETITRHPYIVVGAGITGLMAARTLRAHGLNAILLEKGQSVGGRMATAQIEDSTFDYGAQFFTARDPRFQQEVGEWLALGLVQEWSKGFADTNGMYQPDGHPRYRGRAGMSSVTEPLAQGLEVYLSTHATEINAAENGWLVQTDGGKVFSGDGLILTPPVPQSLALLDAGNTRLPDEARATLDEITYYPCIAVMSLLDGPSQLPEPGAVQIRGEPITWIADNYRKGISDAYSVTIHAGPVFSQEHWNDNLEAVGQELLEAARGWVDLANVRTYQVHRWPYSQPIVVHPEPCLAVTLPLPLIFAGDAFGGPRVEGAAMSGMAAAETIIQSAT